MDHGPLSPGDDSIEGEEGDMGSQTASSQDSSDELEGSADDTLERIALGARERRDSGVGSSLTRASRFVMGSVCLSVNVPVDLPYTFPFTFLLVGMQ